MEYIILIIIQDISAILPTIRNHKNGIIIVAQREPLENEDKDNYVGYKRECRKPA